jgi:hypothetical protein
MPTSLSRPTYFAVFFFELLMFNFLVFVLWSTVFRQRTSEISSPLFPVLLSRCYSKVTCWFCDNLSPNFIVVEGSRWDDAGFETRHGQNISLSHNASTGTGVTQPPIQWLPETFRLELKANHSPPSSAEANTGGFILPLCLGHVSIACTGTAVYFP